MFLTDLYISNKRRSNDVMNVGSIFIGQSKNVDILVFPALRLGSTKIYDFPKSDWRKWEENERKVRVSVSANQPDTKISPRTYLES